MSAADNAKPPRPCTEYNIFFQLERAYILEVLLQTEPTVDDPVDLFHPEQASYTGLPPLPHRYASLILPYDWHLPGKEQRRKRKHRKTHGAISFQDLSNRIANAWKAVDDDVKAYCARVCSAGMARYKTAMKEWKQNGGQQQACPQKKHRVVMTKKASGDLMVREVEEIKIIDNDERKRTHDQDVGAIPNNPAQNEVAIPTSNVSQGVTLEEIKQVFENDFVWMGDEEAHEVIFEEVNRVVESDMALKREEEALGMWNMELEPLTLGLTLPANASAVLPTHALGTNGQDDSMKVKDIQCETKALRNVSFVSNELDEVDITDHEILTMWNNCDAVLSNRQHFDDCTTAAPIDTTFNKATSKSVDNGPACQYDSLFGLKGYTQTMQDMQRMKLMLDQQVLELDKVRRPARRLSIVACSA